MKLLWHAAMQVTNFNCWPHLNRQCAEGDRGGDGHVPDHINDMVGMLEMVKMIFGISVSIAKTIRNHSVVLPVLSIFLLPRIWK